MYVVAASETILGFPTANWALGIAFLALVVSVVSPIYTVKAFRRSGPRVRLRLDTATLATAADPTAKVGGHVFLIAATNRGMAPVEVTGLALEVMGREPFSLHRFQSPGATIPTTLAGLHQELWGVPFEWVPFASQPGPVLRVRAVAHLAGMKDATSNSIQVQFE